MFSKVRKFLRDRSPDWLNTEVNKDLLQNLTANITSNRSDSPLTSYNGNFSPRPELGEGLGVRADLQNDRPLMTDD